MKSPVEAIRSHIVCWYSPKKQGATNKGLLADPRLIDLSGKGNDLNLSNFAYNETSGMQDNGSLRFDGVDDYGITTNKFTLADFTVIARRKFRKFDTYALCGKVNTDDKLTMAMDMCYGYLEAASFGNISFDYTNPQDREINYMTPTKLYTQEMGRGSLIDSDSCLYIGKLRDVDASHRWFGGELYDFILFDVSLTDKQIQWAINNMIQQ